MVRDGVMMYKCTLGNLDVLWWSRATQRLRVYFLNRTIVKYQEIAMEYFKHIIIKIPICVHTLDCSTIKVPCSCSVTAGVPARRG